MKKEFSKADDFEIFKKEMKALYRVIANYGRIVRKRFINLINEGGK